MRMGTIILLVETLGGKGVRMVANIAYMLSAFADYARLTYNKDDVISILRSSDDATLFPSVAQEILPDGSVMQRMNFTGRSGALTMALRSGRMDFSLVTTEPKGFSDVDIAEVKSALISALRGIYDVFGDRAAMPARLAWNTSYLYLCKDGQELSAYRDRFLAKCGFFDEGRLEDTLIRYAARRDVGVGGHEERFNVISTISDYAPPQEESANMRGYRIDYDINTWQGNTTNRFGMDAVGEFVEAATKIQQQLDGEMLPR